jgi:hypothetical protein
MSTMKTGHTGRSDSNYHYVQTELKLTLLLCLQRTLWYVQSKIIIEMPEVLNTLFWGKRRRLRKASKQNANMELRIR